MENKEKWEELREISQMNDDERLESEAWEKPMLKKKTTSKQRQTYYIEQR